MRVRIKLRNQGIKRQPKWWLLVQPCKKNLRGKYLDHIGTWQLKERKTVKRHIAINIHRANYWLSVGAIPTRGAHRVLARYGLLPPLPPKHGTKHSYEKPEKIYKHTHFWGFGKQKEWNANQVQFHYKQKLQEQMNLVERKRRLAREAVSTAGGPISQAASAIDSDAEDTDDIDSDDPDIFERKKKFEMVLKKFNKHRDEKMMTLKGNDLRYNVYLKKLQKLSRKDLGLDVAAYKDYVHNLKEFAHINKDLNVFAYENLGIGSEWDPEQNFKAKIQTPSQSEIDQTLMGAERVQANRQTVNFTIAKFLRTNSGFINLNDHKAVNEMCQNLNIYLLHDPYFATQLHKLYRKRRHQLNDLVKKDYMFVELLEQDVPQATLKKAEVSQKEFNEIKMLLKFDRDILSHESEIHPPNDLLMDNPYSFFVNFDRLPSKIPENIKQLLYRPERMARLKKAYHRLAVLLNENWMRKEQERKDWEFYKHRRLDWHQRQIPKTEEEYALIDKLCRAVETNFQISSEEGLREINDKLTDTTLPITEYQDINDFYKPQLTKIIEERRKIPKQERVEKYRNDSIDEVDTTDLENWAIRGLYYEPDGSYAAQGEAGKPEHTLNFYLNKKMAKEKQAKQRIQVRLEKLYDDFALSLTETEVVRGSAGENWRAEMEQRNFDRSRRRDLLKEMSPEEIVADKKRLIFRFLQDELDQNREYESTSSDEEQDVKGDVFDTLSEQEDDEEANHSQFYRDNVLNGNEEQNQYFEVCMAKERKRIFDRHRFDIVQAGFSPYMDMDQLRQYKKIFKIEMEENPERYTLRTDDGIESGAGSAGKGKQAKKTQEEIEFQENIQKETKARISAIKEQLDQMIPQVKKIMQKNPNYKQDNTYIDLMGEVNLLESQIRELQIIGDAIDPEIEGQAAAVQGSMLFSSDVVISPENLRYLARQLRGLIGLRKHLSEDPIAKQDDLWELPLTEMRHAMAESIKARNKIHMEKYGEIMIDTSLITGQSPDSGPKQNLSDLQDALLNLPESVEQADGDADSQQSGSKKSPQQVKNRLERIDDLLGERFIQTIEEDKVNFEHLAVVDLEVVEEAREMSDEWIIARAEKYEREADELEDKLTSGKMSLRERAEYDKYVPFSLRAHDMHIEKVKLAYQTAKDAVRRLEEFEEEEGPLDEEQRAIFMKDAEISPELEAEYQKIKEREDELFRRQAKDEMEKEEFKEIPQEVFDEVLQEVIDKEGIETDEQAYAFFEEQWEKLQELVKEHKYQLKQAPLEQPDAAFLDSKHYNPHWSNSGTYQYESVRADEFILDRENEEKYHMYHLERLGRYPHGFRHFENYANYSQYKPEATIEEYMEVMNSPCEFPDYLAIMRQHLSEAWSKPENRFEQKRQIINYLENKKVSDQVLNEAVKLSLEELQVLYPDADTDTSVEYLQSEGFVNDCRKRYSAKVHRRLFEREQFTLVQAFEETMDFWETGPFLFHQPVTNTYIPMRHTIMKKPNLLDEDLEDDEFGYQYNNYDSKEKTRQKLHPFEQLSPLRSNRMGPGVSRLTDHYSQKTNYQERPTVRRSRWRRLSRMISKSFSTNNTTGTGDCGVSLPSSLFNKVKFIPDPSTAYTPFRQ